MSLEEEISTQPAEVDETSAIILTGIKQQQTQSKQTRPAFLVLKLAGPTTSFAEWYYLTNLPV